MKAILFYDGSIKILNDDYSLSVLKSAKNLNKANGFLIIDDEAQTFDQSTKWKINSNAKKALMYGEKLFYYGEDNKIYMSDINGESTEIFNNKNNYDIVLNKSGVVAGSKFFSPDGSFEQGQFWAGDTTIKIEFINNKWHKFIRDTLAETWVDVGNGNYSDFVKGAALILQNKIIFTRGAVIEDNVLLEPFYNPSKKMFEGGNSFTQFIQPYSKKCIFKTLGVIDNTGYFLSARDGNIYKYDIINDEVTKWINIIPGTNNDDIIQSEILFQTCGAVIIENEIISFDGSEISRIDVLTGEKNSIAMATNFQGWEYSE
jgi:hypothetical protein